MTFTIGIDNGLSGGLVMLRDGREVLAKQEMPVKKTRKGNEIDCVQLRTVLSAMQRQACELCSATDANAMDLSVVFEEPGGAQSYSAAVSMAHSAGVVTATVLLCGFRLVRITPQAWQNKILGIQEARAKLKLQQPAADDLKRAKKGKGKSRSKVDTKAIALAKARELWPRQTWLASERCKVPHTGIVDAVLIAYYGFCHERGHS